MKAIQGLHFFLLDIFQHPLIGDLVIDDLKTQLEVKLAGNFVIDDIDAQ